MPVAMPMITGMTFSSFLGDAYGEEHRRRVRTTFRGKPQRPRRRQTATRNLRRAGRRTMTMTSMVPRTTQTAPRTLASSGRALIASMLARLFWFYVSCYVRLSFRGGITQSRKICGFFVADIVAEPWILSSNTRYYLWLPSRDRDGGGIYTYNPRGVGRYRWTVTTRSEKARRAASI